MKVQPFKSSQTWPGRDISESSRHTKIWGSNGLVGDTCGRRSPEKPRIDGSRGQRLQSCPSADLEISHAWRAREAPSADLEISHAWGTHGLQGPPSNQCQPATVTEQWSQEKAPSSAQTNQCQETSRSIRYEPLRRAPTQPTTVVLLLIVLKRKTKIPSRDESPQHCKSDRTGRDHAT